MKVQVLLVKFVLTLFEAVVKMLPAVTVTELMEAGNVKLNCMPATEFVPG